MGPLARLIFARREAAARATLEAVGLDVLGRSVRDAPIEEGTLRASGSMEIEDRDGGGAVCRVRFSTPYAARQHEELTWEHPRGGKARYLADNVVAMAPAYRTALERSDRAATRGL